MMPAAGVKLSESPCIKCGQCSAHCPVGAIYENDQTAKAWDLLRDPEIDVVVGSRYAGSGSVEGWDRSRLSMSRMATRLARLVLHAELKDPMSGFFMIRREVLLRCVRAGVSGVGCTFAASQGTLAAISFGAISPRLPPERKLELAQLLKAELPIAT